MSRQCFVLSVMSAGGGEGRIDSLQTEERTGQYSPADCSPAVPAVSSPWPAPASPPSPWRTSWWRSRGPATTTSSTLNRSGSSYVPTNNHKLPITNHHNANVIFNKYNLKDCPWTFKHRLYFFQFPLKYQSGWFQWNWEGSTDKDKISVKGFEPASHRVWMEENWRLVCCLASSGYLLIIFGGQNFMAQRFVFRSWYVCWDEH